MVAKARETESIFHGTWRTCEHPSVGLEIIKKKVGKYGKEMRIVVMEASSC